MSLNLKKILGAIILVIGLIFFFLSIANNNLNLALVSLTSTLIFWTIYSLFLDEFDIQIFSWIIFSAGFLLSLSIFFLYAVEEIPYPTGALIFHANGIAAALGVSFFSLLPVIFLHQINSEKKSNNTNLEIDNTDANPKIKSDDWELATKEELQSGEFEVG